VKLNAIISEAITLKDFKDAERKFGEEKPVFAKYKGKWYAVTWVGRSKVSLQDDYRDIDANINDIKGLAYGEYGDDKPRKAIKGDKP
jgi:hypothetical protein